MSSISENCSENHLKLIFWKMQYSSKENVIECLSIIIEKSNLVIERNEKITSFHDFLSSSTNMTRPASGIGKTICGVLWTEKRNDIYTNGIFSKYEMEIRKGERIMRTCYHCYMLEDFWLRNLFLYTNYSIFTKTWRFCNGWRYKVIGVEEGPFCGWIGWFHVS